MKKSPLRAARRTLSALIQRSLQIAPEGSQQRRGAEDDRRSRGGGRGEKQHAAIEQNGVLSRKRGGQRQAQRANGPTRQQNTQRTAEQAEQGVFGHQLPQQTQAARA